MDYRYTGDFEIIFIPSVVIIFILDSKDPNIEKKHVLFLHHTYIADNNHL